MTGREAPRKFIVWAYPFDDTVGGVIALHLLCRRLNELGETAMLWPAWRPALRGRHGPRGWLRWAWRRVRWRASFNNPFGLPLARSRDLDGAVVVYPEVVAGDPLRADHTVRWLLHRPGFHTGKAEYGRDDLFFFYQEAFDDPAHNPDPTARLTLTWFIDAYRRTGAGPRRGTAYILRKGKGRPIRHDLAGSVLVDEMSHEERAAVFNRVERLYCYDLYTMYTVYAALCGCVPVVMPDPDLSKERWTPDERDRYGIAYGEADVPWALATRGLLEERLRSVRAEQDDMVRRFVAKCRDRFG